MNIIGEDLHFCDFACMFLKMGDEFFGSDFPNSDFSLHTTGHDEFSIMRESYSCDSILMSIVYLPEKGVIVNSESSNLSIRPAWQYDFISE